MLGGWGRLSLLACVQQSLKGIYFVWFRQNPVSALSVIVSVLECEVHLRIKQGQREPALYFTAKLGENLITTS